MRYLRMMSLLAAVPLLSLATALTGVQPAAAHGATIIDLGYLGGSYSYAYGINAGGQIVGDGTHNGFQAAFLLTP